MDVVLAVPSAVLSVFAILCYLSQFLSRRSWWRQSVRRAELLLLLRYVLCGQAAYFAALFAQHLAERVTNFTARNQSLIEFVNIWCDDDGSHTPENGVTLAPGAGVRDVLAAVAKLGSGPTYSLGLYFLSRCLQLLETPLLQHPASLLHIFYRGIMVCTAWMWFVSCSFLGQSSLWLSWVGPGSPRSLLFLYAWVNSVGNAIFYGVKIMEGLEAGADNIAAARSAASGWVSLETAMVATASTFLIWDFYDFSSTRTCEGERIFWITTMVHASFGILLARTRRAKGAQTSRSTDSRQPDQSRTAQTSSKKEKPSTPPTRPREFTFASVQRPSESNTWKRVEELDDA